LQRIYNTILETANLKKNTPIKLLENSYNTGISEILAQNRDHNKYLVMGT